MRAEYNRGIQSPPRNNIHKRYAQQFLHTVRQLPTANLVWVGICILLLWVLHISMTLMLYGSYIGCGGNTHLYFATVSNQKAAKRWQNKHAFQKTLDCCVSTGPLSILIIRESILLLSIYLEVPCARLLCKVPILVSHQLCSIDMHVCLCIVPEYRRRTTVLLLFSGYVGGCSIDQVYIVVDSSFINLFVYRSTYQKIPIGSCLQWLIEKKVCLLWSVRGEKGKKGI